MLCCLLPRSGVDEPGVGAAYGETLSTCISPLRLPSVTLLIPRSCVPDPEVPVHIGSSDLYCCCVLLQGGPSGGFRAKGSNFKWRHPQTMFAKVRALPALCGATTCLSTKCVHSRICRSCSAVAGVAVKSHAMEGFFAISPAVLLLQSCCCGRQIVFVWDVKAHAGWRICFY